MSPPIQIQRLARRRKPALKRALLFLGLLLVLACIAIGGWWAVRGGAGVALTAQDIKRAAVGAWLCPGRHAEWLSSQTVQCLKEKP
ncbi:hypothetical protein DJFAAGMI_01305 [Comamonas sp. PE63]|uniref:Uncharacterized protein n=1 Tax=Comamonas brasiliensis TaxID=1812482 RepID=A0ABS5LPY8_9BURK|nr:hypothetical protein [Comamonas sp. PE63]MBS3018573.1 hypothetical protein [Comamonas sp. PE63]